MDDEMTLDTSVEMEEVAELPESSEETQEVAEPVEESTSAEETNRRTDSDSAFAEMRRANQRLEKENAQMMAALGRYFDGKDATELSLMAQAYAEERAYDDVRAEYDKNEEYEDMKSKYEALEQEMLDIQVEQMMREGLREIQEIDPNVKSLDDLGDTFGNFIAAGLSTKEAYYATLTMNSREKVIPPSDLGKIAETKVDRDYFTAEELDNLDMTDEEYEANRDKIMRSMNRLYK